MSTVRSFFNTFFSFVKTKKFLNYLLTSLLFLLVFLFSGYALGGIQQYRTYFNIALIFFFVALLVVYVVTYKIPIQVKTPKSIIKFFVKQIRFDLPLLFLLYVILISLLSMVINRDFSGSAIKTFVSFFALFGASYAFTKVVNLKTAIHVFRKAFPWVCLLSLVIYGLINVLKVSFPFNPIESSAHVTYNNYLFLYFDYVGISNRNCSIFWEPAVYSLFLCLAIAIELACTKKRFNIWVLLLYFGSLATTFSISGFICVIPSIFIGIILMDEKVFNKSIIAIIIIISLVIAVAIILFFTVPSIREKMVINGKHTSLSTRLYGTWVNLRIAIDHPFGVGFSNEYSYFLEYGAKVLKPTIITVQTSTFGYWISAFGFPGFVIFLLPLVALFFVKKLTLSSKIVLLLAILVFSISEPLQNNMIFIILAFYVLGEFDYFKTKLNEPTLNIETHTISTDFLKNKNNSIFARNSIGTILVKGLAMIVSLVTTSSYISYFADPTGKGMLSLWLTILSVLTWILVFDIGVGHGLKNKLIAAYEKNDKNKIKGLISSAYISTAILSLTILALGTALIWSFDMHSVFNIEDTLIDSFSLKMSLWIIMLSICLSFVLKIVGNIFESLQKQAVSNLLALSQTVLLLLYVSFASFATNSERMIGISIAYLISSVLPMIIATIVLFRTKLKGVGFSFKSFSIGNSKEVISLGGLFFIIQVCMLLINGTNTFIVQSLYNASEFGAAAQYTYYHKIFNVCVVISQLLAGPIWAIVAKAKYSEDRQYIVKLNKIITIFSIVLIAIDLLAFATLPIIFEVWIPNAVFEFSWIANIIFASTSMLLIISVLLSSIHNGLSKLKYQIIGFLIGLAVKIATVAAISILIKQGYQVEWYFIELTSLSAFIPLVIMLLVGNKKYLGELSKHG